ncbi:hypothetical protein [Streptomyces tateyamensis]|uniref:hypothetical protein n=1 Tax=Streptomyces tateyamensis TaxID=565073 RepID=UPI0011B6F597|nr:hypothetical protein [Streptomyces tateyamensis]
MASTRRRPSALTIRVYRLTEDGRRQELSRVRVKSGEPYHGPIGGEWPACRCPRHQVPPARGPR